jgi:hypothetical protein
MQWPRGSVGHVGGTGAWSVAQRTRPWGLGCQGGSLGGDGHGWLARACQRAATQWLQYSTRRGESTGA